MATAQRHSAFAHQEGAPTAKAVLEAYPFDAASARSYVIAAFRDSSGARVAEKSASTFDDLQEAERLRTSAASSLTHAREMLLTIMKMPDSERFDQVLVRSIRTLTNMKGVQIEHAKALADAKWKTLD